MSELFNRISESEQEQIKRYIEWYASSEGREISLSNNLKYILRFWEKHKSEYLSLMFDDGLIIEKEIFFEKDKKIFEEEIDGYLTNIDKCLFYRKFVNMVNDLFPYKIYYSWDPAPDDETRKKNKINQKISRNLFLLMSFTSLMNNKYSGETVDIPLPSGKVYTLQRGCKTSKALGKIAVEFNLEGFEDFRITHSQILNEKTIKGTLCLSIHPLDYMTMSDNDCGWGSCMSWTNMGEYRQGTVEMMNSPYVVVAYLKSATDYRTCGSYIWNSKRWRELFIVTEKTIVGIKGYPFWSSSIETEAIMWLKELAETKCGFGPYSNALCAYNDRGNRSVEINGKEVFIDFDTGTMYNDFCHVHHLILSEEIVNKSENNFFEIYYSGESECMSCGMELDSNNYYGCESKLLCYDCEEVLRCYHCDSILYDDSYTYETADGNIICEYCYNDYYLTCEECQDIRHGSEMCEVFIADDENHIRKYNRMIFCEYCLKENSVFEAESLKRDIFGHYYVLIEDIKDGLIEEQSSYKDRAYHHSANIYF